jgi:proteasome lid subunit RPN8/RPN11
MRCIIARTLMERLVAEAAASPHVEICGLLFGTRDRIMSAAGAANVARDPERRFEVDPAALFAAMRAERAGGPAVIGHYHSHPTGHATPSPRDAAQAHEQDRLWLILTPIRARLWRSQRGGSIEGAFDPVDMDIQ